MWLIATTLLGGVLLVHHLVALPTPSAADHALRDALRVELPSATWRAVHVMYRSCGCSRRTIDHLLGSHRPADIHELVLMVDDAGRPDPRDRALVDAGFDVDVITPDALHARFDLEAAPVLVVMSPDGELAYVGGYNRHKQSAAYEDISIIEELRQHRTATALPVFGCATSARLQRAVDPLGL
ncbi:MAG TPA: hypothetical protein VGC41_22915 [Kofleriaceae bacterium]